MDFSIDIAIFVIFLAVNLIVGLSYGKNVKNIKDYALGGRNFSTGALVATIVATVMSGSGFFITMSYTYSDGLYYLIPGFGISLALVIVACFLVPRMGEFLGSTSVAEAMGELYGKEVRLITALCGIIWSIGSIAVQFKVFGNIFNYFLGMDPTWALFLAAAIVVIYSAFGGIRAVTYTDIVQFSTFGFVIPIIGVIVWNHIYQINVDVLALLKKPEFDYKHIFNLGDPRFLGMIPLFLYFALPSINPTDFQRIAIGKNIAQVKKAWLVSAIFVVVIDLLIAWIPFLIKAINPDLDSNQIVQYVADNYALTGIRGLIIVGIAAMAMSTADSRINAASVLFANDVGSTLKIKTNPLLLSKIFAILWGGMALYLALYNKDLLTTIMSASGVYMVTVGMPLAFTIFGFRSTKKSVIIAMISGITVNIGMNLLSFKPTPP